MVARTIQEIKKMSKKVEPQFRSAYGDRIKVPYICEGESLTQQHFQDECDIKTIIKKHDRTGLISHIQRGVAHYGDYSEVNEYREALDIINNADASFAGLPAQVRKYFNNDAGEFFEFATDPANADKMVELGLAPSPAPVFEQPETAPEKPADPDVSEG
jgi:phage internal scaffolding protein